MSSEHTKFHEISLKDAVEFIVDNRGKTAPTESSGIALIATNCVNNKDLYPLKLNLRYVSQHTYDTWFRSHPKPFDILLTNKGSQNGAVCLVPDPVDFCIAQDMVALRADASKIYPLYLFAALRSDLVQKRIKALNVDAVIPHLKKTDFDKLMIPLPEKAIQIWIGDFYFDLAKRIELLRETNTTLEAIAQALFKSWFVDFDPVHANAGTQAPSLPAEIQALFPSRLVESPQGLIPEGWKVGCLSNLCMISSGKRPDIRCDNRSDTTQIPLYGGAGIMGYTDRTLFDEKKILTGRVGTLGKVHVANPPFWASDNVLVLTPKNHDYFYFSLNWLMAIDVSSLNRGSTQPLLTQKDLGAQQRAIPPKVICNQFDSVAQTLYQKIEANNAQAERLSNLRDTLLPRLISGQLRLPEAEAALAEVG